LAGVDSTVVPVTVVLPVLNESASLPPLLERLSGQTRPPAEIIFVDAGSTDATPVLIERWAAQDAGHPFVARLLRSPGALPGAGRNRGCAAATQPWIAFLDGGLVPEPDWLERLFGSAAAHGRGGTFGVCQFEAHDPLPRALCAVTNGYLARHAVLPASIFHRSVFEEIGSFREDLRSAEDMLWIRDFERRFGPRPVCGAALVHYRHYPSTLGEAFHKWRVGERNSMRAGVRHVQHVAYLLGAPALAVLPLLSMPAALATAAAYLAVRGGIEPMRRSGRVRWWNGCGRAAALAFVVVVCIDLGKWAGIVEALAERGGLVRRARGQPDGRP
jgi:glycosyltransferase involved in cell wall biosynthesis